MNTEQLKTDPMKETEQALLDQIKDQVIKEVTQGEYLTFQSADDDGVMITEEVVNLVANRFATTKAQASCEELNTVLKRLGKDLMLVVCDDGSFDLINPSKFPSI